MQANKELYMNYGKNLKHMNSEVQLATSSSIKNAPLMSQVNSMPSKDAKSNLYSKLSGPISEVQSDHTAFNLR